MNNLIYDDAINDFQEVNDEFTIFVIGQKYFLHRGNKYLKQFINKENWISSDSVINKRIHYILSWIQKKTPNIAETVKEIFSSFSVSKKLGVAEIVVALSKVFAASEHRAAGPEIIDPIIIEEGKVSKKNLTQYITLHKDCTYRPSIIILLKDDDMDRAKTLFSNCPNGTNIKFIMSNGRSVFYKVINSGAESVEDFIDYYSRQCFSTCSRTSHNVLISNPWEENNIIKTFTPTIFKIRSIFLEEHKLDAVNSINWLDKNLSDYDVHNSEDRMLKNSLECINKLFQVYCNDFGGKQLEDAYNFAKEINNDLLMAHVYRYSHFFDCSRTEKQELLIQAERTFINYNIADHAIYCKNNNLIHQFSMDSIKINDFCELKGRALCDTPGLALMAHIINNVGVAYMFEHFIDEAIDTFDEGLRYAGSNHIQRLALKSNKLATLTLNYIAIDITEAKKVLDEIFSPSLGLKRMTYLTAQFALNIIAAALRSKPVFVNELLNEYKIAELIQTAFNTNIMGTGSMIKQLEVLSIKYSYFHLLEQLHLPKIRTNVSGLRLDFICQYGINPFFFNTWL